MGFNIYNVMFALLLHYFAKYYANKHDPRALIAWGSCLYISMRWLISQQVVGLIS